MDKNTILETYARAAVSEDANLCCGVDYRQEFTADELQHIPDAVLDRNYGCGVPRELRRLEEGKSVLDLGPGLGRDCFVAARKVGPSGEVYGLDMNDSMLDQARSHKQQVVQSLGYDNIDFLKGQFDVEIPIDDDSVDVIFSNCVNNLALDKSTAYREMMRVLRRGSRLSFSDIVSFAPLPKVVRENKQAWADCVGGVLSFTELSELLARSGYTGIRLKTDYLWKDGNRILSDYFHGGASLSRQQRDEVGGVRLYSVLVEAFKPVVDPQSECLFKGQYAIYEGPAQAFKLDPDHLFQAGQPEEVCEKTAEILKASPFKDHFTVFESADVVEEEACCTPGGGCC